MAFISILVIILFIAVEPALCITWCHDYTIYKAAGKDANKTSPDRLFYFLIPESGIE